MKTVKTPRVTPMRTWTTAKTTRTAPAMWAILGTFPSAVIPNKKTAIVKVPTSKPKQAFRTFMVLQKRRNDMRDGQKRAHLPSGFIHSDLPHTRLSVVKG